jgi:hypothetical protein
MNKTAIADSEHTEKATEKEKKEGKVYVYSR